MVKDKSSLQTIPGVGPAVSQMLHEVGITQVSDLQGQDAETLYQRLCTQRGEKLDRCVLYTFRCAIYFASSHKPEPEKLKWWNWKDSSCGG
jgi:nucleotidyltransferase/DNA polymerase involved in DNA repair